MSTKIGRNDPCPCGSGKKYKHCHLGSPPEGEQAAQFPFPTVSETFTLGPLLAISQPFRKLFQAERPKIRGNLGWANQLPMPPEVVAQAIRLPSLEGSVIYLRRVPAEAAHALEIAHELLHLVLDAEGFPFLVAQSEQTPLAALLNSLAQDSLIGVRLADYGFDGEKKIQRELGMALASLQGTAPPHDAAARRVWALNYAGQLLEATTATSSAVGQQREAFQQWFREHQPAVAAEGESVLAKAQALGRDTPERMRRFFEWALEHYHLQHELAIISRP